LVGVKIQNAGNHTVNIQFNIFTYRLQTFLIFVIFTFLTYFYSYNFFYIYDNIHFSCYLITSSVFMQRL